jgi:hypothetical protein
MCASAGNGQSFGQLYGLLVLPSCTTTPYVGEVICALTTFHQLSGFYQLVNESFAPVTDRTFCSRKSQGLPRLTGFDENQLCSACKLFASVKEFYGPIVTGDAKVLNLLLGYARVSGWPTRTMLVGVFWRLYEKRS